MIIILNGPPGSGKDTITDYFVEHHTEYSKDSFKSALYQMTAEFFGINVESVVERNEDRALKEEPWFLSIEDEHLLSVREMLIYVSEEVVKLDKGKGYFGKVKGEQWTDEGNPLIISDGGFHEEINTVCDEVGFENVVVIRLHRSGYDFGSDSRYYLERSKTKCKIYDLNLIEGEVGKACSSINKIINSL